MSSLLSDLADVGYPVSSVYDLKNSGEPYPEAIPVLLRWFPLVPLKRDVDAEEFFSKQSIIHALTVPWAKPDAVQPLLDLFEELPMPGDDLVEYTRSAIGFALVKMYDGSLCDDSLFDECVRLLRDERFGGGRSALVGVLKKSKRPEVLEVLLGLVKDPVIDGYAADALASLKAPEAREALLSKVDHEQAWVRRSVKRGLAKLPD